MSEIPPRLLRETLGGSLPSDPSGCLDADTLAAWAEGTLRARERTAAEAHAASCARCQALLAAMVKTAPDAPPARSWRAWTLALGLATPLAAAVALVIWIEMPQAPFGRPSPPARASAATLAKSEQAAPPTVSVPPLPAPRSADRAAETKLADGQRSATAPSVAAAPQQAKRADEGRANASLESKLRQAQAAEPRKEARDRSTDAPAPAASARAEAAPPPAAAAADTAPRATASNAAAAPPTPPTAQPAPPTAMGFSRAAEDQAASRVRAQSLAKAAVVVPDIMSPDANVRWRILTGGNVARSTDGGSTWQTQSTGVAATPTAGSAPSPTLCWLVGPRGTIVVSTDGRSWQRVPFPEAIDLTAIRTSDRANATVTSADGRTFTTTDGGMMWRSP